MTRDDPSERCGLFRTYVSRIETGQANPTLTMIHALAVSLGMPVPALFGVPAVPCKTTRRVVKPSRERVSR